jgi:hypothetical protein
VHIVVGPCVKGHFIHTGASSRPGVLLLLLAAWDKVPRVFSLCFGFGVLKLLSTLNLSDWLRVHLVPNSISMVHHTLADVCDPLL